MRKYLLMLEFQIVATSFASKARCHLIIYDHKKATFFKLTTQSLYIFSIV